MAIPVLRLVVPFESRGDWNIYVPCSVKNKIHLIRSPKRYTALHTVQSCSLARKLTLSRVSTVGNPDKGTSRQTSVNWIRLAFACTDYMHEPAFQGAEIFPERMLEWNGSLRSADISNYCVDILLYFRVFMDAVVQ